jgi:hypothetical protein
MSLTRNDKLEIRVALGTEIKMTLARLRDNRDFYSRSCLKYEIDRIRRLNHVRLHVLNA